MIDYTELPLALRDDFELYVEFGVAPASPFVAALIQNQLVESFMLADDTTRPQIFLIVCWMFQRMPRHARGVDNMRDWIALGGARRLEQTIDPADDRILEQDS